MAKNIQINYEQKPSYQIEIHSDFEAFPFVLGKLLGDTGRKACIITDSNVESLYGDKIFELIGNCFSFCGRFSFPAGEASKNTDTVNQAYQYLITHSFDRKDILIALGGGVVGDLTGFVAATYLRGIDFIQVPTSLLAQVDSSIGGKTGVDFMQYKNMVGAFYMPKLVYMNLSTLLTLPNDQFVSGMGEILKHGQIKDAAYFSFAKQNCTKILSRDLNIVEEIVAQSCRIKQAVVESDPHEQGERALLNFGHTIGHAIEKLSQFSLSHGACVALGMAAACFISKELYNISTEQFNDALDTITAFGLPVKLNDFSSLPQEILAATKLDKKMESGKIKFVLLKQPGVAYLTKELTDEQILDGIRFLFE